MLLFLYILRKRYQVMKNIDFEFEIGNASYNGGFPG